MRILKRNTSFLMPIVAAAIWQILPVFIHDPAKHSPEDLSTKQDGIVSEESVFRSPNLDRIDVAPLATPVREKKRALEDPENVIVPIKELTDRDDGGYDLFSESKVYRQPDVSTFYREERGKRQAVQPDFNGLAGKFINMSNRWAILYWDPLNGNPAAQMFTIGPFESSGTATFPGHAFYLADYFDQDNILTTFRVQANKSLYTFDPYNRSASLASEELNAEEMVLYRAHLTNLEYAEVYKRTTGGREWLSMYPRPPPRNPMWKADYFGQEHTVFSRETHFIAHPPDRELVRITAFGSSRQMSESEPRPFPAYRSSDRELELTVKVVSCAPRVFEIENFLSDIEVDHILDRAHRKNLHRSTTGDGSEPFETSVRTSENTWIDREESPIVDAIYRRAADVLQIDEALLRQRGADEHHMDDLGTKGTIAESLQLVHYGVGAEYTAHHDFGYSKVKDRKHSPNRHANIILYLNEGMVGGETSFPRWTNAESSSALKVVPKKGKAVLFYSLLPDGNSDTLSQHAAMPVIQGEKWMTNLWVWDPFRD